MSVVYSFPEWRRYRQARRKLGCFKAKRLGRVTRATKQHEAGKIQQVLPSLLPLLPQDSVVCPRHRRLQNAAALPHGYNVIQVVLCAPTWSVRHRPQLADSQRTFQGGGIHQPLSPSAPRAKTTDGERRVTVVGYHGIHCLKLRHECVGGTGTVGLDNSLEHLTCVPTKGR